LVKFYILKFNFLFLFLTLLSNVGQPLSLQTMRDGCGFEKNEPIKNAASQDGLHGLQTLSYRLRRMDLPTCQLYEA